MTWWVRPQRTGGQGHVTRTNTPISLRVRSSDVIDHGDDSSVPMASAGRVHRSHVRAGRNWARASSRTGRVARSSLR